MRMQIPSRVNLTGPGSNATNKSCETLRATKRRVGAGCPRVYGARIDIFQMRF